MWVDGMEIEKIKNTNGCFTFDDKYIFITDEANNIIYSLEKKDEVPEPMKSKAQKYISTYDIIKNIHDNIK